MRGEVRGQVEGRRYRDKNEGGEEMGREVEK